VHPSEQLFQAIGMLEKDSCVLEVGCGTSCLSRDLYSYYKGAITIVAADVSVVCIRENKVRDHALITASQGRFSYRVFNILEPSEQVENANDVILDKGCLDTFLFRSGYNERENLVRRMLENVYRGLKDGGRFIVMTPRSRVTLLRDYRGFSSVKQIVLNQASSQVELAELDGNKHDRETTECYMFVCQKDPSFDPGKDSPFRGSHDVSLEPDEDVCPRCGTSFLDFHGGADMRGRGSKSWSRRWRAHCLHCKGNAT